MRKHIYLYELDSVRTSKKEVLHGQQTLFYEILHRGNCVVISYNQLADSPSFLQMLRFPDTYDHILRLFANGSIKVSRYIDRAKPGNPETRTAAQYILHALNKALGEEKNDAKDFIFSGLPIKRDSVLLTIIRDAICYSDPARISELISIKKDGTQSDQCQKLGINNFHLDDLQCILRHVNLILLLSREPLSHTCAKPAEQKVLLFTEYLDKTLRSDTVGIAKNYDALATHYANAVKVLQQLEANIPPSDRQSRSPWLTKLHNMDDKNQAVLMAEAIVNLCYNYTVEDSILGITKRFKNTDDAFIADYLDRLSEFWQEYLEGGHILHNKSTTNPRIRASELPNWSLAAATTDEITKLKQVNLCNARDPQLLWKRLSRWALTKKILVTLIYIPLFFVMEQGMNLLETILTNPSELVMPEIGNLGFMVLSALFTTLVVGLLSSLLSKLFATPDISDIFQNIWLGVRNLRALCKIQNRRGKA